MYRLARLSLANRAVVALTTVAIFVFGAMSLTSLKQELIPSLQLPAGAVVAAYPGTSPEVVEESVTEPLEAAALTVEGIEELSSTVTNGMSVTTVMFAYGTDMDAATQRLQTAITRAQSQLPEDVEPQVVTGSLDDLPVVQLAVAGGESTADLAASVETILVPALEDVADVRTVAVTGGATEQVQVEVDAEALAASGLTLDQVTEVLHDHGVVLPAGTLTEGDVTYSLQAGSRLESVEDLEAVPLVPQAPSPPAVPDDAAAADPSQLPEGAAVPEAPEPVALGDVATVTVAETDPTSYARLDGEPSLGVGITKTPDGNTVEVSHAVRAALEKHAAELEAAGVTTAVVFDQAPFIEESIEGLATEGGLGLVFAVLVILVFLLSVRATLVSAVSIPLSLATAFLVMNVTGYTLNILTLAALTISVGRVVDDAIVVIENIKRHLSYGEGKREAILTAVREVGGAIASSTICTVAVFMPLGFVTGMVGELFRPFAFTVAIAMLASLLVALTIVPVLAYWFVKAPAATPDGGAALRAEAEARERRGLWQRAYVPTLGAALRHPWLSLLVAAGILGGTLALVPRLETNFIGDSGQDTLTVTQTFADGTSLEAQDAAARKLEDALAGVAAVETVQTTVGSGDPMQTAFGGGGSAPRATFAVTLDPDADGVAAQDEVRAAVEPLTDDGPTTDVSVAGGDSGFGSTTVDVVVQAHDRDDLAAAAEAVEDAAAGLDGVAEVRNDLASSQTLLQVTVDRQAAAERGLTETQVAGVVAAAMEPEQSVGEVDLGEGPLEVVVVTGDAPATRAEVEELTVPTASGPVPLTDVASLDEVSTPTAISRVDGERSATVSATPRTQDLGTLTGALEAAVADLDLPPGATVEIGGVAADQAEAFEDLGLALVAAIAIVYVIMVATFGSLVQPLILLVSVPLSATGALVALLATGTPLGVPALIGVLMLVGIVVSNAIVLIDLINQYRARGRSLDEAVREGARKRLRPIVMTALATIFALTPMALGVTGGGAFISRPLALVVIGGLVSSTLLTLLVVPVLYTLVERRKERRRLACAGDDDAEVRRPRHAADPAVVG
ncbi:efflux RND transporter permease subunit [Isoptericola variabilis]|uniref:Acriflavin resistance protein n=1 Tax=Isoptericola variabilis (strain 225) TaxID=743718 RepID=F6FSN6_ISOV2|nr:efflux RND transporter permease subunit [Isoptericola variabilis]AEG45198.1 acriflavin resistance protein [Isoptericola variabilis 225]TWH33988.1 HAE1 family hydrophobic/amphiphilic exporter-1 [Isoptericola variabilis J7]